MSVEIMAIWSLEAPDTDQDDATGPPQYQWPGSEDAAASPLDVTAALLVSLAAWPLAPSAPPAVAPTAALSDPLPTPRRRAFCYPPWRFAPLDLACLAQAYSFLNRFQQYVLPNFGVV